MSSKDLLTRHLQVLKKVLACISIHNGTGAQEILNAEIRVTELLLQALDE
jgi:hypothetical protein